MFLFLKALILGKGPFGTSSVWLKYCCSTNSFALSSHRVATEHVQGHDNSECICLQFVLEYLSMLRQCSCKLLCYSPAELKLSPGIYLSNRGLLSIRYFGMSL